MGLGRFAFSAAWRARYIAVFIDEVQELVITIDSVLHQHLGITVTALRLLANVPPTINEVQVCLVITLQVQLLNFFCHLVSPTKCLDSAWKCAVGRAHPVSAPTHLSNPEAFTMKDIRQIAPEVTRIPTSISNAYLVGNSDQWVLIDCGTQGYADTITEAAERRFGHD